MKKSRRTIAIIITLLMLIAIAVSCKSADNTSPGSSNNTPVNTANTPASSASPAAPASSPDSIPYESVTPPPSNPETKFADHIELVLDGTPIGVVNFNSPAGSGTSPNMLYKCIYDTLAEQQLTADGSQYEAVPMLATSWDTTDYQTWIFHLRDDVYFTNGDKFKAQDVVFTIKYSQDYPGSQANNFWSYVQDAVALDDNTVQINLKNIMIDFPDIVSSHFTGILNERAISEDPDKGIWVGTGAFKVTDFQPNDSVSLERNDNYWQAPVPTKTMTWRFVPEASARTIMLQNGTCDICFGTPDTDVAMFQNDPNYAIHSVVVNFPNGLHFNMNDKITGDKNFRFAVAYAINREEITLVAQGDWGVVATDGTVWGYKTKYRNTDIPFIAQDIEKAKEYLAASNYKGEVVELVTATANFVKAAQVVQDQLSKIGINIQIKEMDTPGFSAYTLDGNTQMIFWSAQMNTSLSGVKPAFYPGIANNRARYDNPDVSKLLDSGEAITDPAQREALYLKVQELVAQDLPVINVFYRMTLAVADANVGGVNLMPEVNDLRYIFKTM